MDPATEYELRKLFYRTVYYETHGGQQESMRSGWSSAAAQSDAYAAFLPHIERPGNLLDLGCGDGRLLAFLHGRARVDITPYGVDFLEESVEAARTDVLPKFGRNLFVRNVSEFHPGALRFSHIITNPFYVSVPEQKHFLRRCLSWVEPGGSLLLYEYAGASGFDVLLNVCHTAELPECTLHQSAQVAIVRCPRMPSQMF